ncbi:cytochrome c, class I (plasmid) [Novosphingobium aromaticivorans DSM 12444]|uniref:Cytochrome c, class I n=1 Tax=Novosphingobium aromaticivorans (strain ATCC 700278 / DSM 12444 / CCUG 56034 / CIP 105152 / NBRC 16084 / F199) TaxID=279238 RepID=A4XFG5_NOVAD|nr:c-type cytochrome [Novosphingobium aromaticivorans]ABP64676.1 cytochrome c, class I [Novosphingobium aromaticivorans DSM 12444]
MSVRAFMLTAGLSAVALASGALATPTADVARGKALFARCAGCHAVVPGARSIGPNLAGVEGRKAASAGSYAYSPALARLKITWDRGNLDKFLAGPQKMAPGSKMAFAGLADPGQRADVIAYLATLQD